MKATIADFHHRFVVEDVPTIYPESPQRVSMTAVSDLGHLKMRYLYSRHFSVCEVDMHLKHNTLISVDEAPGDKIGFYMLDNGRGGVPLFGESKFSNTGYVSSGDCYIAFNPSLNELHQFDAQQSKPFYIEATAEYFASLMDEDDRFLSGLKDKINNREFFGLKTKLTPVHYHVAKSIYHCQMEGALGNMMMEGGFQQFVALQLAPFIQPSMAPAGITYREKDIMYAVKEYLHENFQQNHSLIGLSKMFGINQAKLKKSFKELFGVPVIEYLYNLKMQYARTMLFDQGKQVKEVAAIVGYRNANHFATAFKRKFGVKPSRV